MKFKKYQHLERYGNQSVSDIEQGDVYVFPKIDGTNSSVWLNDEGNIAAGSRNRELSHENDNAGFYNYIVTDENIKKLLNDNPNLRLYGEWLVPHSLKTYRENAWRKFYIFDVLLHTSEDEYEYLPYPEYKQLLDTYDLEYIAPLGIVKGGNYDNFINYLDKNQYLIEDGKGNGEGIVLKNYNYTNYKGDVRWAKIVSSEFKELHSKKMGAPVIQVELEVIEQIIVDNYCTKAFIEKEYHKLKLILDGWDNKHIPRLLSHIWYEFINEEIYNAIKKLKNPKVDFKLLNQLVLKKVKFVLKDQVF